MGLRKKLQDLHDHLVEEGKKGIKPDLNGVTCAERHCDRECRGNNHYCEQHLGCF